MNTLALIGLLAVGGDTEVGAVSKVDTLSIHIRDLGTFNSVFTFLTEELKLPVVYGSVWTPEKGEKKQHAGVWAGNVTPEPCAPFPDTMYRHMDFKAMFYGLAFDPCESMLSSLAELDRRGIEHKDQLPAYAYVHGEMSEKGMGISIRHLKDTRMLGQAWKTRAEINPAKVCC